MSDFKLEMTHANMLVRLVETGPLTSQELGDAMTRESLVREGFASKIVFDGEDNFVAATYLGKHIYCKRIVGEDDLASAIRLRKKRGVVERLVR